MDQGLEDDEGWSDHARAKLIGEIVAFLSATGEARASLETVVASVGEKYLSVKFCENCYSTPKQQRRAIRAFSRRGGNELPFSIAPEYAVTIEAMAERLRDAHVSRDQPEIVPPVASFLQRACRMFDENYTPTPGRRVNLALEEAVRALLDYCEGRLKSRVVISQNRIKPDCVKLVSPEAQAIGMLLCGIDPSLTEVAIVNMIAKIRRAKGRRSESPLLAIFRADPGAELACSLFPDREAAIAEIYLRSL